MITSTMSCDICGSKIVTDRSWPVDALANKKLQLFLMEERAREYDVCRTCADEISGLIYRIQRMCGRLGKS